MDASITALKLQNQEIITILDSGLPMSDNRKVSYCETLQQKIQSVVDLCLREISSRATEESRLDKELLRKSQRSVELGQRLTQLRAERNTTGSEVRSLKGQIRELKKTQKDIELQKKSLEREIQLRQNPVQALGFWQFFAVKAMEAVAKGVDQGMERGLSNEGKSDEEWRSIHAERDAQNQQKNMEDLRLAGEAYQRKSREIESLEDEIMPLEVSLERNSGALSKVKDSIKKTESARASIEGRIKSVGKDLVCLRRYVCKLRLISGKYDVLKNDIDTIKDLIAVGEFQEVMTSEIPRIRSDVIDLQKVVEQAPAKIEPEGKQAIRDDFPRSRSKVIKGQDSIRSQKRGGKKTKKSKKSKKNGIN